MNSFIIYTDGSCLGNPGPGGWAAIILNSRQQKIAELSGGTGHTTNNRMEMQAMIEALNWLHQKAKTDSIDLRNYDITLYSDSNLLIKTLAEGWKRKANLDLWSQIDALRAWLPIKWIWVKAHSTNHFNNEVDIFALNEAKKQASRKN